jgi:hypothetical protein
MYSYDELLCRSESDDEIVVEFADAIDLLDIFEERSIEVLGWEGWIKYSDGAFGHSQQHQGTGDLSSMPQTAAIALVKSTIIKANSEWQEKPEASNARLLFCITTNT